MWHAFFVSYGITVGVLAMLAIFVALDSSRPSEGPPGLGFALVGVSALIGLVTFVLMLIGGDPFYTVTSSLLAAVLVAIKMKG